MVDDRRLAVDVAEAHMAMLVAHAAVAVSSVCSGVLVCMAMDAVGSTIG